jgi:hypothetical protein
MNVLTFTRNDARVGIPGAQSALLEAAREQGAINAVSEYSVGVWTLMLARR